MNCPTCDMPDQVAIIDPQFVKGDASVIVECWQVTA